MNARLVLATANPGKVAELIDLLGDRFIVEPRPSELAETIEDGDTLEKNAKKKATEVAVHTKSMALADDTGLFVEALGGRPGVYTARYAGPNASSEDNVTKLLTELKTAGDRSRAAAFRTVMALVSPDGTAQMAHGEVVGQIAEERAGDGGFGYDPVFVPDEGDGRTFAQMAIEEKHLYSHRARALQAVLALLSDDRLTDGGLTDGLSDGGDTHQS